MNYKDKLLTCSECNKTFTFTVQEQEFFATKGYTYDPKRCPPCRAARRQRTSVSTGGYNTTPRKMYPAICATCGKDTEVPFEPIGSRPIYCRDCYIKKYPPRRF